MNRSGAFLLVIVVAAACSPKPILYPNAHYKEVGEATAEQDIEECKDMAKDAGAKPSQGKTGQVAGGTAAGGAVGSAAGAVGGGGGGGSGAGGVVGAAGGAPRRRFRSRFRKDP